MAIYVVLMGSNIDASHTLAKARVLLSEQVRILREGELLKTEPYNMPPGTPCFLNQLLSFETSESIDRVAPFLKSCEQRLGRHTMDKKKGEVIIDIDLLSIDQEIVRPKEFQLDFVKLLWKQFFTTCSYEKEI